MPLHSKVIPALPPPWVTRVIIVGAGGFGREVLQWARDAWPAHAHLIAGFLSANADCFKNYPSHSGLKIFADPEDFKPDPGDALLLAIGIPESRRRVAETLGSQGATFLTLIHPTAIVAPTARIGEGSILCPYSIVSDSACLGRLVVLNYHTSLGHDASAGDYSVLSPYATLGGGAVIAEDFFMGMHSSIGPGKKVGARSKVSANSAALNHAPEDSIVYGVPGRSMPRFSLQE